MHVITHGWYSDYFFFYSHRPETSIIAYLLRTKNIPWFTMVYALTSIMHNVCYANNFMVPDDFRSITLVLKYCNFLQWIVTLLFSFLNIDEFKTTYVLRQSAVSNTWCSIEIRQFHLGLEIIGNLYAKCI